MKKHTYRVAHPVAVLLAGLLASFAIVNYPSSSPKEIKLHATRAKIYGSLDELTRDSQLQAVVRQVTGPRERKIRDFTYRIADFEITSKDRRGEKISVTLPVEVDHNWEAISKSKLLAYLDEFTFGDQESFDLYVFTGDGQGLFESKPGSGNGRYQRMDKSSADIPASLSAADVGVAD